MNKKQQLFLTRMIMMIGGGIIFGLSVKLAIHEGFTTINVTFIVISSIITGIAFFNLKKDD